VTEQGSLCKSSKTILTKLDKNNLTSYKNALEKRNCFDINLSWTFPISKTFTYKNLNPSTSFFLNWYNKSNNYQRVQSDWRSSYSNYTPWFSYNGNYTLNLEKPISYFDDMMRWDYVTTFSWTIKNNSTWISTPFYITDAYGSFDNNSNYYLCINQDILLEDGFISPNDNLRDERNLKYCSTWKISSISEIWNKLYWSCNSTIETSSCNWTINNKIYEYLDNDIYVLDDSTDYNLDWIKQGCNEPWLIDPENKCILRVNENLLNSSVSPFYIAPKSVWWNTTITTRPRFRSSPDWSMNVYCPSVLWWGWHNFWGTRWGNSIWWNGTQAYNIYNVKNLIYWWLNPSTIYSSNIYMYINTGPSPRVQWRSYSFWDSFMEYWLYGGTTAWVICTKWSN